MVLKQIKRRIDDFCETWDDILDRVYKLPSDLMGLYQDMQSRFGKNDVKYVMKAARKY
jgi:hypothetical protein